MDSWRFLPRAWIARKATTMSECQHDKVRRDTFPHGWFCDNCNAAFAPESIGPNAASKLIDDLCNLIGVGPEKLAEKVAEWRDNLAELTERLNAKDAECAAAIDITRGKHEDAMKIHNARLEQVRAALAKAGRILHKLNDDGHKRRVEDIDALLAEGGVV